MLGNILLTAFTHSELLLRLYLKLYCCSQVQIKIKWYKIIMMVLVRLELQQQAYLFNFPQYLSTMNCLKHIQKDFIDVVRLSGRGIMRIGHYGGCVESSDMDYKLIRYYSTQQPQSPIYTGLCLPSQCSGNQLETALNLLIKQFKIPIVISSIDQNIENIEYDYNWGFYILFIILSILLTLTIISSSSKQVGKHPTLSIFSLKNSLKLFHYTENPLNVLNGVKSLSMMWVVFGHQYSFQINGIKNILTMQLQTNKIFYLVVEAGVFAVDTFFFVGGFLVSYAVLKEKNMVPNQYPLAILNRYLRFIPSYFIAILIYYSVFIHLGSGPLWSQNVQGVQYCSTFWKTLLFVDNLVDNGNSMCMNWGWYLQNDMQIFIYCILILFVYNYSHKFAYFLTFFTITISWAFTMQQTYEHHYHNPIHLSDLATWPEYISNIYIKPWFRCPPYLYGLILGILYTEMAINKSNNILANIKQAFLKHVWIRRFTEIIGVSLGLFLILIIRNAQNSEWTQLQHSLYLTYAKTFFPVAISLIILPSLLGIKTLVTFILDTKFFNFIGKISFWTYLIHLNVMDIWGFTIQTDRYLSPIPYYPIFVSHALGSMLFGTIFTFLVEIPFSKLQKKLMQGILKKSATNKPKNQEKQMILEQQLLKK